MNTLFDRRLSFLLSLTTITVLGSGLSAQAETITPAPVPGTTATSAAVLTTELPVESPVTHSVAPVSKKPAPRVAQDIDLDQAPYGNPSYVGIAGNIGLSGGESSLGVGSFTVISNIRLLRNISLRPAAVIGDNTTVLIPLTYDFSFLRENVFTRSLPITPYLGAGVAINTGDRSDTGALISAGVDVPLTREFTATAGVNVGFINNTSVGLLIGIGYNFSGLGFGI